MESIEIHYDPKRAELSLNCGRGDFARLCEMVIVEAGGIGDCIDGHIESIHLIDVSGNCGTESGRLRDRVALLGCGLAASVFAVVFAVGTVTIIKHFLAA